MATRRLKRPRDPIQLGKLIVNIATGQVEDQLEDNRDAAAVELGRRGGLKGGKARAAKLSRDMILVAMLSIWHGERRSEEDRPRRDRPCTVTRSPVADRGNYQRDKTKRLAHLDAQGAPQTGPVPPTHHPQL
jgi:hypothetical protein